MNSDPQPDRAPVLFTWGTIWAAGGGGNRGLISKQLSNIFVNLTSKFLRSRKTFLKYFPSRDILGKLEILTTIYEEFRRILRKYLDVFMHDASNGSRLQRNIGMSWRSLLYREQILTKMGETRPHFSTSYSFDPFSSLRIIQRHGSTWFTAFIRSLPATVGVYR